MNGSVYKLTDRRHRPWRAVYTGPDGRRRTKSFARKAEAERWLRNEVAAIDRGGWVDPAAGKVLFREWAELWLADLDVKPKTAEGYRELLASLIYPTFGQTSLARITPAECRVWVARLSARGLSASRTRQARAVLRQVLATAVHDGRIVRNPVDGVKPPKMRTIERRFLTVDQVEELIEAVEARSPGSGLVVEVLAWGGLRWGELVALKLSRINVDDRRITVAEAVTEVAGKLIWGSPKTHEIRTVTMPPSVADAFAKRLSDGGDPGDLVFRAPHGGPLRGSNWRHRVWQPALKKTTIDPRFVPHELRHTAASLMIASGASIKAVQRQLGHASAAMTLDRYGHLYDDDLDALSGALDELRRARSARDEKPEDSDPL